MLDRLITVGRLVEVKRDSLSLPFGVRVLTLPGLVALQLLRLNYLNLIARQLYAQNSPNSRNF